MTITSDMFEDTRTQIATYWQASGLDGNGKRVFVAPVKILTRWSNEINLVLAKDGENIPCRAQVWIGIDIAVGDYLGLGDQTGVSDPTTSDTAYIVFDFTSIPSVMGDDIEKKAYLAPTRNK